jgi:aromatic ring-cleaving dioxygenase
VLRHFVENKTFARHLFTSAAGRDVMQRISRELAQRIESHLEARVRARAVTPAIPLQLIATQVAESQFALVRAWLSDDRSGSPADLARAMRRSAVGAIAALL